MRVLVDTCVVSELQKPRGSPLVRERFEAISEADMFLSVLTLGELAKGIALLNAGRKKSALTQWLHSLEAAYSDRILPIDAHIASLWGEISAAAQRRGKSVPVTDGLIAATAIHHGLHVMTRNVDDFLHAGAMVLNPWQ